MVKKKVKNPLRKRYLREIKSDFGKYLAIFLLMLLVIGEVSGYLVADESMIKAYNDSFEKYRIENGNFTVQKSLNKSQKKSIEGLGVSLNELFYTEVLLTGGQKIRIFQNRTDMDQACVMEGRLAEREGEIAIDQMFADNNHLKVGDSVSDGTASWEITGLVALSDYSALFEDNNDSMFDAIKFCVGVVSPEEFAKFSDSSLVHRYAWKYQTEPADEKEEKTLSDDFLKELKELVHLEGYIPRYLNQAIRFTGEDMGGDKAMMSMFLYIVIVILAFVFGVTISNTIAKEANAIGTLRASGFADFGYAGGCFMWKYLRIYDHEERQCVSLLWQLLPADLRYGLERQRIFTDHTDPDRDHAGDRFYYFKETALSFSFEFPAPGSEKEEKARHTETEQKDSLLHAVQAPGDPAEYPELYRPLYWHLICRPSADVRASASGLT